MKKLIICVMAFGGLGFLPSCTVEHREPHTTTTTTTEETVIRRPMTGSVETTTYRSN